VYLSGLMWTLRRNTQLKVKDLRGRCLVSGCPGSTTAQYSYVDLLVCLLHLVLSIMQLNRRHGEVLLVSPDT
jgi:hypothetical protein